MICLSAALVGYILKWLILQESVITKKKIFKWMFFKIGTLTLQVSTHYTVICFTFAFILDCNVPEGRDAKIQKIQCLCHSGCKLNVCQMNAECSAAAEKGCVVLRNDDDYPASVQHMHPQWEDRWVPVPPLNFWFTRLEIWLSWLKDAVSAYKQISLPRD